MSENAQKYLFHDSLSPEQESNLGSFEYEIVLTT
jgi:hypothetical protein